MTNEMEIRVLLAKVRLLLQQQEQHKAALAAAEHELDHCAAEYGRMMNVGIHPSHLRQVLVARGLMKEEAA